MADAIKIEIDVEAVDDTGRGIQSVIQSLNRLNSAANRSQSGMNNAARGVSRFDQQANRTTRTLQNWMRQKWQVALEAKDRITPILSTLKSGLTSLTRKAWRVTVKAFDLVTAPIRGIFRLLRNPLFQAGSILGISIGLKDTIDTFKGFEAEMSKVQAISGASTSEIEKLTEKAKEMGASTKFTAQESAEAFEYMAMAGWKTNDMMNGIEGILHLAAASGESLGTTSDIVTDALTAFNMKASDANHFADVLAAASSNANTNVGMMGETFKYVGAMAGTLGYSIEDVGLAVGLMANSGIKASQAGTELNSIFTRLSVNTSGARDAIEKLGVQFFDETGSARKFSDILGELRTATADMTDEQKTAFANTVAGTRAQAGLLAMLNATEADYNKLSEAVNNADGAAGRMAETMQDNLAGSLTKMQSAVEGAKLTLGERLAPYLRSFADYITASMPAIQKGIGSFMDWFDQKVESFRSRWKEATGSLDFQNADFFGKAKILWDDIIATPLSEWWNSTGKQAIANPMGKVGSGIGIALKTGLLALFGIDIGDAASDGVSIGKSFAQGFVQGFDGSTVLKGVMKGIGNLFSNVGKILPGGEAPGLDTVISGGLLAMMASPIIKGGKFLFGGQAALGGSSLMGTMLGSASAGTGLLGLGSNAAIAMGAGNLAGGASLGAGALSAVGLGAIAGGVIGGGTLISGFADIYRRSKAETQAEKDMYRDNAVSKIGGVASGAALGAMIGSVVPVLGTIAGGLIGAGVGGIAGLVKSKNRKQEYEEAVAAAEAEAAAQELLTAKTDMLGMSLDDVKFKSKALNDAFRDSSVSAEEFGQMFSEAVSQKTADAFGDIVLSAQEIKDLADSMVFDGKTEEFSKFADSIETANKKFSDMSDNVKTLEKLNWKASLGVKFSEEDKSSYLDAADQFAKNAASVLNDKHYEATLAFRLLGGEDVDLTALDATYTKLEDELASKTVELNEAIERAFADGQISTEPITLPDGTIQLSEYEEITNLQNQVSEIVNRVAAAEQSANLEALKIKYGGSDLSAETFAQLQTELKASIEEATSNYDEALKVKLKNLKLELDEGAINQEQYDAAVEAAAAEYHAKIEALNVEVESFQLDTIADAFSGELDGILPQLEGDVSDRLSQALHNALAENPNPEKWTTSQMVDWFDLDGLDTVSQTAITEMLQGVAESIPEQLRSGLSESMDTSVVSEAISEQVSSAIENVSVDGNYDGVATSVSELIGNTLTAGFENVDISDQIGTMSESIGTQITSAIENVSVDGNLEGVATTISEQVTSVISAGFESIELGDLASGMGESISSQISSVVSNIQIEGNLEGVGASVAEQVKTAVSAGMQNISFSGQLGALGQTLGAEIANAVRSTDLSGATAALSALQQQIASTAQSTLSKTISVSIPVSVTFSYTVTNPNPPRPNGGGGTVSYTPRYHAAGGFTNGAELSWVGEDGPEAIIPLSMKRRERGLELYEQVGEILGVAKNANGGLYGLSYGITGGSINLPTDSPWDVSTDPYFDSVTTPDPIPYDLNAGSGQSFDIGSTSVKIDVTMQPTFTIEGGGDKSEDEIVAIIRRHLGEMADEMGGEIAERLIETFENMPARGA